MSFTCQKSYFRLRNNFSWSHSMSWQSPGLHISWQDILLLMKKLGTLSPSDPQRETCKWGCWYLLTPPPGPNSCHSPPSSQSHSTPGLTHNRFLHCLTNIHQALAMWYHCISTDGGKRDRWRLTLWAWFSGKSYKRHQGQIHWGSDTQFGGGDLEIQREHKQHTEKKSSVVRVRGNCNGAKSWTCWARNSTVNLLTLSQDWQVATNGF